MNAAQTQLEADQRETKIIKIRKQLRPVTIDAWFKKADIGDVADCEGSDFFFDFSACYGYDFGELLRTIILTHRLKNQDCRVFLKFPEPSGAKGRKVWNFLKLLRYFRALNLCVDNPVNLLADAQIRHLTKIPRPERYHVNGSAQQLFSEGLFDIHSFYFPIRLSFPYDKGDLKLEEYLVKWKYNRTLLSLQDLLGWEEGSGISFVTRVIHESLLNSLLHSDGNIMVTGIYVDEVNVIFCLCDNGKGIPDTLRKALKNNEDLKPLMEQPDSKLIKLYTEPEFLVKADSQLISFSTQKGVTSDSRRKGFGLFYLKDFVVNKGGELSIRSGEGLVKFKKDGVEPRDGLVRGTGTLLEVKFPRGIEE